MPGGFVSKVNNTCIQVLDSEGDGVFFLLNEEDEDKNVEDEDYEEDIPEITYVEDEPEEEEVEYVDVDGKIPEVEFIDEDIKETNPPVETTTRIPVSVLDPSRFDIVNDKITSSPTVAVTDTEKDIPTIATSSSPSQTTEAATTKTSTTVMMTTTPEDVTTAGKPETETTTPATTSVIEDENTTLFNDPTLNVDPGLLE